ncbi:Ribonuclease PH [Pseudobythopirellula maris]|uniref:Ribonuclease PH n=1 Tax=Pseudobythopirellula maris TaxID=2527991 RepID=A0A5C5ZLT2_9BACT|nr:ribonuclease PH [Pseudobythopirellula maris]TWT88414.1 Ribonuclease PH [Pseudobythopirellula maris]
MTQRHDGRSADQLRPVKIERGYPSAAPGSVLISMGQTMVLCTASVSDDVPPWMRGKGKGWVTAEYNMLPGSTSPRKQRDRKKVDGRTTEIQRLIGRSLRASIDLEKLGEASITVDCDVLRADGGTRTASITGGMVALIDAVASLRTEEGGPVEPFKEMIAAVSVGVVDGEPLLDLDYPEDSGASVDMNVIVTAEGRFVELQGSGEEATFSAEELARLIELGQQGAAELIVAQRAALSVSA